MEYLSGRVGELTKAAVVKHEVDTQTDVQQLHGLSSSRNTMEQPSTPRTELENSQVRLTSSSYELRLPNCKDAGSVPTSPETNNDLERLKREHLDQIRELYECEIDRKYREISRIKATMHSMLEELSHCVYSEEGLTKILRVDRDIIEEDNQEDGHPFVKRSYVRTRLTKRTISTSKNSSPKSHASSRED